MANHPQTDRGHEAMQLLDERSPACHWTRQYFEQSMQPQFIGVEL